MCVRFDDTVGENFGPDRVRTQLQNTLSALNGLITQHNAATADSTQHLGLIPQRLPSLNFKANEFADKGYAVTDIDALTGAQRYAHIRFDDSGQVFNLEPASITPELQALLTVPGASGYPQLNAYLLNSALARQAIAPMWEVQTARMQETAGDLRITTELIAIRAMNTRAEGRFGLINRPAMNDMDWGIAA